MPRLDMRHRADSRRREFVETGSAPGLRGRKRWSRLNQCRDFWSLVVVWGSRGNVWGNGAGVWRKPRGCVRTVNMEDAACVWEPSVCMGNGNPMKARNMKPGCGLRTLRIFGNVGGGGGSWVCGMASSRGHAGERRGRQSGHLEFLSQHSLAAGCSLPVRARGCHHGKLPKRPHVRHCSGVPRMPLVPLRAVGTVQAGAAIGTGVAAGLYVDHRVPAHGALLYLACSYPPNAREPLHITHTDRHGSCGYGPILV